MNWLCSAGGCREVVPADEKFCPDHLLIHEQEKRFLDNRIASAEKTACYFCEEEIWLDEKIWRHIGDQRTQCSSFATPSNMIFE